MTNKDAMQVIAPFALKVISFTTARHRNLGADVVSEICWEAMLDAAKSARAATNGVNASFLITACKWGVMNWRKSTASRYLVASAEFWALQAKQGSPYSGSQYELMQAVSQLAPLDRAVVYGHVWQGLGLGVLAGKLNRSEITVKRIYKRALEQLKQVLEPLGHSLLGVAA